MSYGGSVSEQGQPGERGWQPGPGDVVLEDAAAIRALAHPARLLATELLFARRGVALTATELAAEAGLTPSAMSYHLRALERHGLVVRAEATGDERQRPWRAAGEQVVVRSGGSGAGEQTANRAATDLLLGAMLERLAASLAALSARAHREDPEWRVGGLFPTTLHLSAAETAELSRELAAVVERYAARHERREPGTRTVAVTLALVPEAAPED